MATILGNTKTQIYAWSAFEDTDMNMIWIDTTSAGSPAFGASWDPTLHWTEKYILENKKEQIILVLKSLTQRYLNADYYEVRLSG